MRSLQGQEPLNLDIVPITAQRQGLALGNITPAVIVTVMLPLLVLSTFLLSCLAGWSYLDMTPYSTFL